MAEKNSYPQIPSTVWWGTRSFLQRSPNATIDERFLGIELKVQEVAARQYLSELRRVGVLGEDGKATPLAQKWRHDESYLDAVDEILKNAYPPGLIDVAPPGNADRQKVTSWFMREGLGSGTAANKAATYLLIGSKIPNEAPIRGQSGTQKTGAKEPSRRKNITPAEQQSEDRALASNSRERSSRLMPLNINLQIHISADSTNDQIEAIFSAMRRYLYDNPAA